MALHLPPSTYSLIGCGNCGRRRPCKLQPFWSAQRSRLDFRFGPSTPLVPRTLSGNNCKELLPPGPADRIEPGRAYAPTCAAVSGEAGEELTRGVC